MTNLATAAKALEAALRAFSLEIARTAGKAYEFRATIEKSSYEDAPIIAFYARSEYDSFVRGNFADATWEELRRRQGWNEAHTPMALLAQPEPKRAPVTSSDDDSIPF